MVFVGRSSAISVDFGSVRLQTIFCCRMLMQVSNLILPSCPFSSTLCTEEVLTFLNTRMLFWACSTNRPEGYRGDQWTSVLIETLNFKSFRYIVFLYLCIYLCLHCFEMIFYLILYTFLSLFHLQVSAFVVEKIERPTIMTGVWRITVNNYSVVFCARWCFGMPFTYLLTV